MKPNFNLSLGCILLLTASCKPNIYVEDFRVVWNDSTHVVNGIIKSTRDVEDVTLHVSFMTPMNQGRDDKATSHILVNLGSFNSANNREVSFSRPFDSLLNLYYQRNGSFAVNIHKIILKIDPNNQIAESKESDNNSSKFVFPVHICSVVDTALYNPSRQELASETDTLNKYFVDENRKQIVVFWPKSVRRYAEIANIQSDFISELMDGDNYADSVIAGLYNQESNSLIKDARAINFYIYDSYKDSTVPPQSDITSHGKRNNNRPFVLLDYVRTGHNIQSPEEHEMGHCFGLTHMCDTTVTSSSSSNIMTSSGNCPGGRGGLRDIGFDSTQVQTILSYAELISKRLFDY